MLSLGPENCKVGRKLEELSVEDDSLGWSSCSGVHNFDAAFYRSRALPVKLPEEDLTHVVDYVPLAVQVGMSSLNLSSTIVSGTEEDVHQHPSAVRRMNSIRDLLYRAKREARVRQRRLRIPTVCGGALLISLSSVIISIYGITATTLLDAVGYSALTPGCVLLLLGFLPSDHRAVRLGVATGIAVCVAWFTFAVTFGAEMFILLARDENRECALRDVMVPCWFNAVRIANRIVWAFASLCIGAKWALALKQGVKTSILLSLSWRLVGMIFLTISFTSLVSGVVGCWVASIAYGILQCVLAFNFAVTGYALAFVPNFRQHVQSWLMSRGEAVAAAAGVAELLSGRSTSDVLAVARQTFSSIRADRIRFDHMLDNTPNTALAGLSERANLGSVDAFVSHSWHDDPYAKWRALQKFRLDFKAKHFGREPMLWIDKYCIDQRDINNSLAALPVYLSGCAKLLIISGPTYLERMWCLIEIFVFLEMGGQIDSLEVYALGNPEAFKSSLEDFRVASAQCFDPEDEARLRAVLQVDEGGIEFLIRTAFAKQLEKDLLKMSGSSESLPFGGSYFGSERQTTGTSNNSEIV